MKLPILIKFIAISVFAVGIMSSTKAQTLEWRLGVPTYSAVDPDGAGPALGSATFTLQIHTTSGTIPDITGISTGWSYQTSRTMLPTGSPCGTNSVPQPANITMSTAFSSVGFTYNNVNECSGSVNFTAGGQTFDRRASGTVDGGTITLTTAWTDVFTVTLWTLGASYPEGGYVSINSGSGGTNVPAGIVFSTYAVSDLSANEFAVNSLTYTTPLPIGSTVPVSFTKSSVSCSPSGASVVWGTASESNTSYFEVLKSVDGGNNWVAIDRKAAAGNSATDRNYQSLDLEAGAALYKIRQVDRDGRSTETAVMRSACEAKNAITSLLYPVPAKNNMTLAVTATKMVKTTLQIVDSKGRLMQSMETTVAKGNNNIQFNVSRLAAGEYMLISTNPELQLNKKFVVAR